MLDDNGAIYIFIHAPDPDRVGSYISELGFNAGVSVNIGMLLVKLDGGDGAAEKLIGMLNSNLFLHRRVNRAYICDSEEGSIDAAIRTLESRIGKDARIRLQVYPKSIEGGVIDAFDSHGVALDPSGFTHVAYIVSVDGRYFIGLYGRDMYFSKESQQEKQISRAYYKIAEAASRFGIQFSSSARVLDIGAAPGGWSQFLSERVALCVSVDPAKMEISKGNIKHIEKTFQEGIEEIRSYAPYDMIVCDANIDPRLVASFVSERPELLSDDCALLVTLKLKYKSGKSVQRVVDETSAILSKGFNILSMKKLLSNTRMEMTMYARKS
ncbi:THUMP domain-containing protein [mine drainage metagenome]|uniref:THUMP domain-containing protein n=1 Tax=mine drainage metagenome TaxID=410659 RepID=T0Z9T1_9ZZZZ